MVRPQESLSIDLPWCTTGLWSSGTQRQDSLNIRGLALPGKWEEIGQWMVKKQVDILLLQETKANKNQTVVRKVYMWYFSGNNKPEITYFGIILIIKIIIIILNNNNKIILE